MMYLQRHTNKSFFSGNFAKSFVIFFVILVFIFVLNFFQGTRSLLSSTLSPFFRTGGYFYEKIAPILEGFHNKNELIKKNDELSYEIENMRLSLTDYEALKDENERLRQELGIKPAGEFVASRVIARSPQIPLDSLIIDKGTNSFLNEGRLVIAGDKFLIGKIVKVWSGKSTVALNSFPGAISYGYIARTNEPLEIIGVGGGSMQTKVPLDFDIALDDKIMVEGFATYVAAIVASIEENESSGFKNILMSLPADISKTRILFIEPFSGE